jgi:hypothetical protein
MNRGLLFLFFLVFASSADARSRVAYETIGDIYNEKYHACRKERGGDDEIEKARIEKECNCIYKHVYNELDFSYEKVTFENGQKWREFNGIWIDEKPVATPAEVEKYIESREITYKEKCKGPLKFNPFIESPTWDTYEMKEQAAE